MRSSRDTAPSTRLSFEVFTLENFLGYIETEQNCGVQKIVLQDFEKELLASLLHDLQFAA